MSNAGAYKGAVRQRASVAAFAAAAFLVLILGASTHIHTDLDGEDGCAVHMAVVGKLEGPSTPPVVVAPRGIAYLREQPQRLPQVAFAAPILLPPSCGPPHCA